MNDEEVRELASDSELARPLDNWFGNSAWPDTLARTVELIPALRTASDQRRALRELVDDPRRKVVLIPPGDDLAEDLDRSWGGSTWRGDGSDGLAAWLDTLDTWKGWENWGLTLPQLREYLIPVLVGWDQETPVAQPDPAPEADPATDHLDPETGRMRHLNAADNQWEYLNPNDNVWERVADGSWLRYHGDAQRWLAYDAPSQTYLDPLRNEWLPYAEVGRAVAPGATAPAPAPDEATTDTPTEQDPPVTDLLWVTPEQQNRLVELDQGDWHVWLPDELTARLGDDWVTRSPAKLRKRLEDMIDLLALPSDVVEEVETEAEDVADRVAERIAADERLMSLLDRVGADQLDDIWDAAMARVQQSGQATAS